MLALPYIAEAMVVGVADAEFGQRVAALVSLQEEELADTFPHTHGSSEHRLTLAALRRDLSARLAGYKMPTLLRLVDGELPKTATGKVQKKRLGPHFFPSGLENIAVVQKWWKPGEAARL